MNYKFSDNEFSDIKLENCEMYVEIYLNTDKHMEIPLFWFFRQNPETGNKNAN